MKYHIVFKFVAVMLCAIFLLSAVGSGFGILAFTEMELYEKTVDELYDETITALSESFAGQTATRYAGNHLGGSPETILGGYGIFTEGYYAYKLYDPDGTVVDQLDFGEDTNPDAVGRYYSIPVSGRKYMKLISTAPVVDSYEIDGITTYGKNVINNIPYDGVEVGTIEIAVQGANTDMCYTGSTPLGTLDNESDGSIRFCSSDMSFFRTGEGLVYGIVFYDMDGQLLYKAANGTSGVGQLRIGEDGYAYFGSYPEELINATHPPEVQHYQDEYFVYDAVPPGGATVQEIQVDFLDGDSEGCGSGGGLGVLFYTSEGDIRFNALDSYYFLSHSGPVTHITFKDAQGNLLYEAGSDDGSAVGIIYENDDGILCYEPIRVRGEAVPNTTAPLTEAPGEPETTTAVTEMPTEAPTEVPTEAPDEAPVEIPTAITDNIERLGVMVANITFYDEKNYTTSVTRDTAFGYLSRNEDGTVTFRSNQDIALPENVDTEALYHIAFQNAQGQLLYEVQSPNGVGYFSEETQDRLIFISTVTPADVEAANAPATTEPVTEPETSAPVTEAPDETPTLAPTEEATEIPTEAPEEEPTEIPTAKASDIIAEVTEPVIKAYSDDFFYIDYWDSELQENVRGKFIYEDLPEGYVLELWLLPGAFELDPIYDLLQFVWDYRAELFYVLGISVFLFAVFAVYLCCAAGRKPGREEIRPSGFNRIPLDVYGAAGGLGIYGLALLSFEGSYYLLRNSPHVIAPYIAIAGYIAALIIVGFCFACAAQFKTPGGFWWKNLLFVRAMMLVAKVMTWFERILRLKVFPFLVRAAKFCWRNGIKLCKTLYRYTDKFLTWFVKFAVRATKALWKYGCIVAVAGFKGLEKALTWLGKGLGKIAQRTHAWLHAFLSLLPVTWQWLLIGLALLAFLALSLMTRSEAVFILSIVAGLALVVYGSHCFGILWDRTKKMSKGDLDTKVDDKLMVGCFKDFAGDLNALADVAMVAAQKQMKSERMKTELITNVSHDIKTPLTSIINYVDLLQKPHSDEEQEVYLEVLARQSQQMKKLLEDLIDMSKASTGNMTVYVTQLDAKEALNQVLGEFADKLDAAQLIPVVRQPEEQAMMLADGRLVWRVLSNVLSNVVKYAMPGTRVYIDLVSADDIVQISVKNISREALNVSADELMERFVRGDASRNTEGSGLGLNIARSLMDIQKGKLELLVDGDLFKVTLTFPTADE